jgi:hypothetical protein
MADYILPVKAVVSPVVGSPTPGVACQPIYQVGADGLVRYRDQDGTVLAFPGGVSHSTVLGTCPATGPTVAPTTEGHYYWTSALGEIWVWVYGDSAPFVAGMRYGAFTTCIGGVAIPYNAFTNLGQLVAPRAGILSVSASVVYSLAAGWDSRYCDIFKNGTAVSSNIEETRQPAASGLVWAGVVASTSNARVVVAAGDIISMGAQIGAPGGTVGTAGTSIASAVRGLSIQYVN